MTKFKYKDLEARSKEELLNDLANLRHNLLDLKMRQEGTSLKNVKELRETRRGVARILTVLRKSI